MSEHEKPIRWSTTVLFRTVEGDLISKEDANKYYQIIRTTKQTYVSRTNGQIIITNTVRRATSYQQTFDFD